MNNDDLLRDSLARISDQAKPVDFVDRSLSRSKRIGRNQRIMTSAAALLVLAVVGGLAWQLGRPARNESAIDGSATPSATASPTPSLALSSPPSAAEPGSVVGLPGWLYYADADRLVRLTKSGVVTVSGVAAYSANVSPDGASIVFIDGASLASIDQRAVVVTDRDGQHRRTVLRGTIGAGFEPVWSPDSQRLLAVKAAAGGAAVTYGIVTIASDSFTPLAHQPQSALHVLWSADGKHLGYATGTCQIATADADGGNARIVPVFGDRNNAANEQKRRSCDPYSISPDGRFIAVNQRTGDQRDGDIARGLVANAVIDTRTGDNVTLPVTGSITAVLFQPNGDILVRTTNQLTLLNPDRTVKTQITEPAAVKTLRLLAYTPN